MTYNGLLAHLLTQSYKSMTPERKGYPESEMRKSLN